MSRDRRVRGDRTIRRLRSRGQFALATGAVTVLSLTASGCVVVHGEREIVPAATRAEAARALKDFTTAYNEADKAYDRSLDAGQVTGPLADIDGAKLEAGHKNSPAGNAAHSPLELTDAKFTIPEKAGWPRWFLADTDSNKGSDDTRWLVVFTRGSASDVWEASYLTVLAADGIPEFEKDADGWAQPVTADDAALAVEPDKLGQAYATYLASGGDTFAPGAYTSELRALREKNESKPGLARQYVDEPLNSGDYAPVGLRTKDGGALVFFTTRHFEKQTAAQGVDINVTDANIKALMTGEVKQSLTLEFVANEAVLDPAKGSGDQQVKFLSRVQGLTGAKGE
ncbi:hypothetical protein [Streptomyces sp. NBC_00035]|uniref:hypothetical protein n=1 Tax=unclassified Streptomyces TaxID=2593676 RepID=UPI00308A80A2|nr:hypothetical protein OHT59_33305 [Streptomyces sp. NBC_00243]